MKITNLIEYAQVDILDHLKSTARVFDVSKAFSLEYLRLLHSQTYASIH